MHKLASQAAAAGAPWPPRYHRFFWLSVAFGFPAFAAVLGIFWLVIARPAIESQAGHAAITRSQSICGKFPPHAERISAGTGLLPSR
ncbi:DUF2269 family protein [Mesorhizobium sp. M0482]